MATQVILSQSYLQLPVCFSWHQTSSSEHSMDSSPGVLYSSQSPLSAIQSWVDLSPVNEKQSLRSLVTNWWEEAICEAFGWRQSLIFICLLSVLMGLIFNRWSWMFHATPFLCGATEVSGGHRSSVGGRGRITAQHPLELGSKSLREAPGWPRLTVRDTLDQKHLSNLFTFSHSTLCGSQESNLFWSN